VSTPAPHPSQGRVRRLLLAVATLLAIGGAAVGVWALLRPPPAPVPEVPAQVEDPEVRASLEEARAKVIASPRDAAAWGELGLHFFANLFDRPADQCFEEAARLDPDDARWPYARGVIALKRDPGNAVALLRQAAAASEPGPEYVSNARLLLAEALLERRELDEAERLFTAEANHPAGNARATLGLGLVARARGDEARAERYLIDARASQHTRIQATIQLAAVARARGDTATAVAMEKEAAAMPDDRPWPDPLMERLAELRVGRRARERAIDELERDRRYDLAADMYLSQAREQPTVAAYCGAAVNFARLHEYDRAAEVAREAIRLDEKSSQGHYTLALVQFTRAEKELARSPGSAAAKDWLREASKAAERATELKPDHGQAYLFWGVSLKLLGEPAAAVEPLRKGIACQPDHMLLHLSLGEALTETGNLPEAETYLENARRVAPDDPRVSQAIDRLRAKKTGK
jgi:tetratricopeptide (TPR) repeat protein